MQDYGLQQPISVREAGVRVFEDPVLREAISHRGLPVSTAEELLGIGPEQRPIVVERALAERWDQTMAREAVTRADAAKGKLAGVVQDRSAEAMGGLPAGTHETCGRQ
jgi:hypothetical protein